MTKREEFRWPSEVGESRQVFILRRTSNGEFIYRWENEPEAPEKDNRYDMEQKLKTMSETDLISALLFDLQQVYFKYGPQYSNTRKDRKQFTKILDNFCKTINKMFKKTKRGKK